jgi:class 3 adenylate cyclase
MDIGAWLRRLGLEQYEAAFRENEIDDRVLPSLMVEDLKDLGVGIVGHRRWLLDAIAALCAEASEPAPLSDAPLATAKAGAERRQVTVMISDLVGSTVLSAHIDPEDLREVISAYQTCVADAVRRFEGFVAKYMGDGVLIYFGYPQAHEDDAERAVRAALEAVAAVAAREFAVPLQIRIGIATGLVVVGDLIGTGSEQEQAIVGETPNLAARLQGIAEPNTIVIAETTRRLLGNLFELQELGPRELKGIAGPVKAFAVLRASSVEGRFDAMHTGGLTELVGREEELNVLLRRWARAKTSEGQVVLLSGEAGIGKSRLSAALMEALTAEAHTRLRYFCSPQHTDSAFYPLIGQLERAAGFAHGDTLQTKLDKLDALPTQTSTSKQDAALLAEMLSLPNDGRYPALEFAPEQRRQKTLEALGVQLETLAHSGPVLMIIEDAHWADPTSVEVFGRTVDRIANLPVLLIVTFRPEFEAPWVGQPHVTVLALNRLGHREVNTLIERVAEAAAGKYQEGHCRAHRRRPAVCRGDDKGGAGGRGRAGSDADCGRGSLAGSGSPRELACFSDGTARPARPRQGGGPDRSSHWSRIFARRVGGSVAEGPRPAQIGARPPCSGRSSVQARFAAKRKVSIQARAGTGRYLRHAPP